MGKRDAVEIEVFKNIFHSIAEEMGAALRRTAFSPNIKERRDYSCAVFAGNGDVVAMGDHMPVHLGSMPMSVRAAIEAFPNDLHAGDAVMLNDPFAGGTHLPDLTVVMPVFVNAQARKPVPQRARPDFYVASRAHHADVGGTYPGSMGLCEEIYQEGVRIPPVKIMCGGTIEHDVLALLLNNVRTPQEREGDLGAQIAACHAGAHRLREVCRRYSLPRVRRAMDEIQDYADELMRALLAKLPEGTFAAEDFLDDDGYGDQPVRIVVAVTVTGGGNKRRVIVDFSGSSPQVRGSINAVEAITYSACFYVFRCLAAAEVSAAAGLMRAIRVIVPRGTIVNAVPPAAVAGGNVETSQRVVDTLLRAMAKALPERIPAAASGTMNNLTIGGMDDRDPANPKPFAYYETIAGGMGARPTKSGANAVHTHMTNSLNTPAEALEHAYPLRVTEYSVRKGSGGRGKFRGGDGVVREIELLSDAQVTMLADRRRQGPYGLADGAAGAPGENEVVHPNGSRAKLPAKGSVHLKRGDRVRISSPGGGGWGRL
ncbi:MAG TPA: hydantoinase B/oxoprolinase family protein [Terriglobales bacterium]|nr:hydantoinase B/oxoprolinase family protein [Terriglobales bacterium]